MAFTFETSGNNTFLVYTIQEDTLDTMTLGMISNNRIPGISSVLYTQMNRDRFLKYNVTAKVTVKQFFSGVVNKRRLLGVFSSVAAALAAAEEYMIDSGCLLLDTDYIYADVSNCRAEIICLPVARETGTVDVGLFFKNIMFSTQFDQTENCDYVARIINHLNSAPVFVVDDFVQLLEELQGMSLPDAGKVQAAAEGPRREVPQPVTEHQVKGPLPQTAVDSQAKARPLPSSEKQGKSAAAMGFAVPGQAGTQRQAVREQRGSGQTSLGKTTQEKEMSLLYLLQHYTKENAASYKAQKEARKNGGKAASVSGSGFVVPGQQPAPAAGSAQGSAGSTVPGSAVGAAGSAVPVSTGAVGSTVPGSAVGAAASAVSVPVSGSSQVQQSAPSQFRQTAQPQIQQPMPPQLKQSPQHFPADDNFGDTVVMGADGYGDDTVVIGEAMAASIQPYLRRISNNEKILLSKPTFRIGKERSYVDYCISGNATVSRSHADIVGRDGQFFIVDNNSTNHTYVNGEMIPSSTEIPLSHGTRIRLSNEEFEFLTF